MNIRHAAVSAALAAGLILPAHFVDSAPQPQPHPALQPQPQPASRAGQLRKPGPDGRRTATPGAETTVAAAAAAARPAHRTPGGRALMRDSLIDLAPCTDDDTFLCGTLRVRFDRRFLNGPRLNLHVEVFPHQGPSETAEGAVFVTDGGPGLSISLFEKYNYAFFLLDDVAQTRDLVFIDQRGVGLSDAINCPAWQHGGPFYQSAERCHDRLGDKASRYSTTDVADDLNAVRKALKYKKIDLLGGSYAGTDMLTYAVRHTEHVRSVLLGAPAVTVGADPFFAETPRAYPRIVNAICRRSPACAAANSDPDGSLAWLAARLRRQPVRGTGIDSMGVPHELVVTENVLATRIMAFTGASFVGPGEITQAAAALRRGDKAPLLRLAADVDPVTGFDSGYVRDYSNGHNLARTCVDFDLQWDKQAPEAIRHQQYAAALRAEPALYGPIAKGAWAQPGYNGYQPLPCITSVWEDRPNYPAGTRIDGVRALVFGGEYDLVVPNAVARLATDVLTDAEFVNMTAAGHVPWWYSDCGRELVQRFVMTREAGDTSCAAEPAAGWWMPGSFPTKLLDAPAAQQISGPTASKRIRRLATVTAWTVLDGITHNFSVPIPFSTGLRGGTVTLDNSAGFARLEFDDTKFTRDVRVDGSVSWPDIVDGELDVTGPMGGTRHVALEGSFLVPGEDLTVTIEIDGRPARFSVPGY